MTGQSNLLTIDAGRLWGSLEESAKIGAGPRGGLRRLALGDDDRLMRDLFTSWCEAAGLSVKVDKVGNMFARRPGRDNDLPPVLMGSHLDSQASGGRYDGILGVLAGLEVVRSLNDRGIDTRRPIEIVNWTNEEGARFTPPMVASGAFAGVFDLDWVLALTDDDGHTFGEELARIGYAGQEPVGGRAIDAYFELHIEQGPLLELENVPVGIVVGGYKSFGMHIDVHGETAHSGPTPMDKRRNALVGAAHLIVAANDIGWRYHDSEGKATAPRLVCWPNKPGILPEYAQVTIDFRHAEPAKAEAMLAEFEAAIPNAAERAQVAIEIVDRWTFGNETFDQNLVQTLREAAADLGVDTRDILSQAGHDAYYLSRVAPTAMIFSPCKEGITHNEAEAIELDYTVPSVDVLLNAVVRRADR